MTRFLILLTAMAALFLGGCADNLMVQESADASEAPFSPNPIGHIPAQPRQNPLGAGAPPF